MTTGSVVVLLEIMLDSNKSIETRLDAAEQILTYEAPEEAVQAAKEFLAEIFEDKGRSAELRVAAIKLMRKSEARKITKPTVQPGEDLARRLEAAKKRLEGRGIQRDQ